MFDNINNIQSMMRIIICAFGWIALNSIEIILGVSPKTISTVNIIFIIISLMGISTCLVEKLIRLNNFDKYKKNMNKAQKHKFDYNKNKNKKRKDSDSDSDSDSESDSDSDKVYEK